MSDQENAERFFEPLQREGGYFTELSPEAYRAAAEPFPPAAAPARHGHGREGVLRP